MRSDVYSLTAFGQILGTQFLYIVVQNAGGSDAVNVLVIRLFVINS